MGTSTFSGMTLYGSTTLFAFQGSLRCIMLNNFCLAP